MRHARGRVKVYWLGLIVALLGASVDLAAGAEPFGGYENWRSPTIRVDRWSVTEAGTAQEIRTEVNDGRLVMRQRREGTAATDFGSVPASQGLAPRNPAAITQWEVD